jgi:hypothetical protein
MQCYSNLVLVLANKFELYFFAIAYIRIVIFTWRFTYTRCVY